MDRPLLGGRHLPALASALLALSPAAAPADEAAPAEKKTEWVKGPATVDLGSDLATLSVDDRFLFAGARDTRSLLERMGNQTDGSEVGLVVPRAKDQDWFLVFEHRPVGYVKDDEKGRIDADGLLESIRDGTEEANAWRKSKGIPALHVVGWYEPPRYDAATHNLSWAIRARDEKGGEVVNYNVRLLGRGGFMSVTLVDDPDKIAASKPAVNDVLANLSYKKGKTYAEWVPGDKVAEYGLTALVATGAGAAAVKLGLFAALGKLLAKGGKLVVAAVAAIGAVAYKLWNAARGRLASKPPSPGAAG